MSDRLCNFCLHRIRVTRARRKKLKVQVIPNTIYGGVDVYVAGKWECWYMELPDQCRC